MSTCENGVNSDAQPWKNSWVAGFTSRRLEDPHYLFYLMRIGGVFKSQSDLWCNADFSQRTKQAKSASHNCYGDMFCPLGKQANPFGIRSYKKPRIGHCHRGWESDKTWHKDIRYKGRSGNNPVLLVGEPALSFLWGKRMISLGRKLPRDYLHYLDLDLFLAQLQTAK